MKNWHPKSWQAQARDLANRQFDYVIRKEKTVKEAIHFFSISYRADIVRYRAVGIFVRKLKNYKGEIKWD